jgi:hypothetical protein
MAGDRQGLDSRGSWLSPKRTGLILGLLLAAALAVVVANRMGPEALSVVVGVICGVAAGIPTSLLLLAAMSRRERRRYATSRRHSQAGNYPPVVVIQGGVPQTLRPGQRADHWPSSPPRPQAQSRFHVVGGEDLVDDGPC